MAPRISDNDVDRALKEWQGDGRAQLRPEQVQRIAALSQEKDPEVRAAKTVALTEEIIREVEVSLRRGDEYIKSLGIEEGGTKRFMAGDRLSDDAKRKLKAAIEGHQREVLSHADIEAKRVVSDSRAPKMRGPRAGRISV
jgi:hypothetical protein